MEEKNYRVLISLGQEGHAWRCIEYGDSSIFYIAYDIKLNIENIISDMIEKSFCRMYIPFNVSVEETTKDIYDRLKSQKAALKELKKIIKKIEYEKVKEDARREMKMFNGFFAIIIYKFKKPFLNMLRKSRDAHYKHNLDF